MSFNDLNSTGTWWRLKCVGILREGYITVNIISPVSGRCYRVLSHMSHVLQIMSNFKTKAAWDGSYNEWSLKDTLKGAIGITIAGNIQLINNKTSIERQLKYENLIFLMLNRLMKNEHSFSFPVISGNYPAQNNKYFFWSDAVISPL